jgi:hypothetical protein
MKAKGTYRVTRKYSTEFTLRKHGVVINDISYTRHKEYDAARRQIEEVAEVLCKLCTEKVCWSGLDITVFDIRVKSIYEGSNLFQEGEASVRGGES